MDCFNFVHDCFYKAIAMRVSSAAIKKFVNFWHNALLVGQKFMSKRTL